MGVIFLTCLIFIIYEKVGHGTIVSDLAEPASKFDFSLLPKIIFVSKDNQVITSFLDESNSEKIKNISGENRNIFLDISPNGKYYSYAKWFREEGANSEKIILGVSDLQGKSNLKIEDNPSGAPAPEMRWSPDSKYLSWIANDVLKFVDVTQENSKINYFKFPCAVHVWSPDLGKILCRMPDYLGFYVIDVEKYINYADNSIINIEVTDNLMVDIGNWHSYAIGSDPESIVAAQQVEENGFNLVKLNINDENLVKDYSILNSEMINNNVHDFRYSPDGKYILYTTGALSGIGVVDLKDGKVGEFKEVLYPGEEEDYLNQGSSPYNNNQFHAPDWYQQNDNELMLRNISADNSVEEQMLSNNESQLINETQSKIGTYGDDLLKFNYDSKYFFPMRKKEIEKDNLIGYYEIIPYAQSKEEDYFFKDISITINKNEVSTTNDKYIESWTATSKKSNFDSGKVEKIKLGNYEFVKNMTPDRKAIFYVSFSSNYYIQISCYPSDKPFTDDGMKRIEELISSITYKQ